MTSGQPLCLAIKVMWTWSTANWSIEVMPARAVTIITELCNASLQQGCLPLSQRHAIIRPRLKKAGADPSDVKNYRPVSNLAFMAKIGADRGEVSLLCMLDLSAAFDAVDHGILIDRLRQSFEVQGLALSWIESFLCDRSQVVSLADELSSRSLLSCGVLQGSVLGPLLLLVYCADVLDDVDLEYTPMQMTASCTFMQIPQLWTTKLGS